VALADANSKAGGVMLATNKVNSGARAYIDQGSDRAASPVLAGGEVRVFAADNAGIDAHTKIEVTASTTNDGGLDIALKLASAYLSEYQFTTESGSQFVREGDLVRVAEGYAGGGLGGALYMYDGADATVNVGAQNYATSPDWVLISASTFYDDVKAVLDVLPNNLTNVTKSDAIAAGGMFVRNDVRSDVEAAIRDAIVTADGSVSVTALESATILALIESTVLSDGGSVVGGGDSIAVNGTVATNLVLSSAVAAIDGSVVTANAGGSVTVLADNTSNIDAIVDSSTISNGTSVGVVLAFNTIGIQPQNWLFSTVDALIGTNIANEQPAATRASITDSSVQAGGAISVTALSDATIHAEIRSASRAIKLDASGGGDDQSGASGISIGAVLAMNKISTDVKATIESSQVRAGSGDISLLAQDAAAIHALVDVSSLAVSASTEDSTAVSVGLSLTRNVIRSDTEAFAVDSTLEAEAGSVTVTAVQTASIDSTATASSIAVSVSAEKGKAFSGGGATAVNLIFGKANAFLEDSTVEARGASDGQGEVVLEASNESSIVATVKALSVAVAASTGFTPAVAIGFALARNLIGWREHGDADPVQVKAYVADTDAGDGDPTHVRADRGVTLSAHSDSRIDATVQATAAALAASSGSSLAVSGAGLWTDNKISTDIHARIDGASEVDTGGGTLTVTADDRSTVTADAQAIAIAASLSGSTGAAISIGLSLAHNTVDNDVQAAIVNTPQVLTGGGDVIVRASSAGSIDAQAVAVAVSAGIGATTGVAISGGAAESTNVVLSRTNAFVQDSALGSAAEQVGKVDIDASSTSRIDATIAAVAAAISFGGTTGVGVALGISVARNFIGWDPLGQAVDFDHASSSNALVVLNRGDKVKISQGALAGEVYEYLGTTLTDSDPNTDGAQPIDLTVMNYRDVSTWRHVSARDQTVQVQAFLQDSSVDASGALTIDAVADQDIRALVIAGAVAVSGGGTTGVGVSGAGAYAENRIKSDVKAFIDGDGDGGGIGAASVHLAADDRSAVNSAAGAASVAVALGGTTGVAVALGLSLSFNEVDNAVEAFIRNADQGITSAGAVTVTATAGGEKLFDIDVGGLLTATRLDDASQADSDDPDAAGNQATQDLIGDQSVLVALRNAFANKGLTLATFDTVATASMYTTTDVDDDGDPLTVDLREGTTVEAGANSNGQLGRVYRYIGADRDGVGLAGENYGIASNWVLLDELKLSMLEEGRRWSLVAPDGATYLIVLEGNKLVVGQDTISAVSAAASLAAGFGGTAGVAVAGAGAVAQNVVLSQANAYAQDSVIDSAGDVSFAASSDSTISSIVAAASLAIGGGGTAGVGVSIGIAVAQNFIGWQPGASSETPATVMAYLQDSSVTAGGDLELTADASQSIHSVVVAGSAAVAAGGTAGIGAAGSGVWAENKIGVDVKAFVDGDNGGGISADRVTIVATDASEINAIAGAASLALSLGGTVGVSVAIGVSLARNTITSDVEASVANVSGTLESTVGAITVSAEEDATIQAISAAAAIAAGFGGVAGVAVSGAGAYAANVILTGTRAYVEDSTLDSAGAITITADNTSSIDATIVAAAVSLTIGGTAGVGASIGAALSTNLIGFTEAGARPGAAVEAYIEDSSILHGGALTVAATTDLEVDALVLAGSVAIAGGLVGVAAAGAGAISTNRIGADVAAFIDGDGAAGIHVASVSISAEDDSRINANTGAAAVAASFGAAGASLAIGLAMATNEIDNTVEAGVANAANLDTSSGGISITADENARVDSLTVAAAAAVSVSIGGSGAGALTTSSNTLTSAVSAYIDNSGDVGSAGDVTVSATDHSTVSAEIFSVALSAGLVSLAVGVALVDNTIGNDVSAYIQQSDVTALGSGDITVTASSTPTISSSSIVGAVSFGLGGSGAGGSSNTTINGSTQAYVNGGTLTAIGDDVTVSADATSTANPRIEGLSVGLAAVSVMTSNATIAGETRAWAGGALTLAANGLEVTATDNTSAAPVTIVNGGGAFAISITEALIEISRKTEAQVVSGANIDIGGGHLTLLADATTSGVGSAETASVSAIDIGLTTIETVLDNTTRAAIEPLATVRANGGNVSVSALADNRGDASIKSLGVGLLLRVGISEPSADVSATTEALAQGSIIGSAPGQSAGNVTVLAQANDRSTAGSAAQGGGLISVSTSSVNATTTSTVQAGGGGVIDSGGSVSIQAFSRSDADASSKSSSGGAVDVSNLEANASASPTVNAFVDPGARITARQGLTVAATHGEDPPVYSDGSFNAVSGVDPAANTIGFGAAHGLLTGDTVSYNRNGAATAVGGLVDGRNYGVIVANDTTLRLGATFGSFGSDGTTPRIDLARDTITFAGAHNLQDGDRVVYSTDAGSATIGGLSSGNTYVVKRVDANTIKLADVATGTRRPSPSAARRSAATRSRSRRTASPTTRR
jgi:hypothetical protein